MQDPVTYLLIYLLSTVTGHILTPMDRQINHSIEGIEFLYCSKEEVQLHSKEPMDRFDQAHTVSGTRDNHCYKPVGLGTLQVSRISGDDTFFTAKVSDADVIMPSVSAEKPDETAWDYQSGQYIACMYDGHWWLGNVCDRDYDQDDVKVNFMHLCGPTFSWPRREDMLGANRTHFGCR